MDYTEAVRLAKKGDERGYRFLYDATYESKFYLALQYMKNREAAEDVMQEAYLRAFSGLDMLREPEAFAGWFGRIVANTAKNMLKQKNPVLFSDMGPEDEGFEYWIEDADIGNQPELAYTRQETQDLVRELIDSLSEEQRMCILMFHIEGLPIRVIADTLECSENTVKSRLNYGRKNLRAKAEELQQKGWKLYSAAPIWLLLYLLRQEEAAMYVEGALSGGERMWKRISGEMKRIRRTGKGKAPDAAKAGFLHTAAGKAAIGVIGVITACAIGVAAYFAISHLAGTDAESELTSGALREEEAEAVEHKKPEEETDSEEKPEKKKKPKPVQMTDGDYPRMIAGNLTKEDLEAVLAYGPQAIPEQGFTDSDYLDMLNAFCNISYSSGRPVAYYGPSADWQSQYSLTDVNRLFASFSDFAYTEDNDADTPYGVNVEGDVLIYAPATINYSAEARILTAEYTEKEMQVYFTYSNTRSGQTDVSKMAALEPLADGLYRIVRIEEISPDRVPEAAQDAPENDTDTADGVRSAYAKVLKSVQAQEPGYDFNYVDARTGNFHYFLHDMNGDQTEELIVGAEVAESVFFLHHCRVYTCEKTGGGYAAKPCEDEFLAMGVYLPADENGLFDQSDYSRGTGKSIIYRITLEQGRAVKPSSPEYEFTMGDAAANAFYRANAAPEWKDISDY